MTSEQIPLGQKEDQRLEFKSRDALQDRFKIGREVVGMLNAEGGEIWVGLAEEASRAVRVEPIEKVEVERKALRDFLVDTIEPPLSSEEIEIRIVPDDQGGSVLKIQVQPNENRRPYAVLKQSLWDFRLRIDERLRPMSREEIFRRARDASRKKDGQRQALNAAIAKVQAAREKVKRFPKGTFWLHFEPVDDLSIGVRDPVFHELVEDPALTGNRRSGKHFARASARPVPTRAGVRWAWVDRDREEDVFEVEVGRSGNMTFRANLKFFFRTDEKRHLWPYTLVEYPTSAFRVAGFIYRELASGSGLVVVEPALLDIEDWGLWGGDPTRINVEDLQYYTESPDLIWEKPLVFDMAEIQDEPDRCGFRLLRRIYEAFGYRETEIPFFDRDTGRLVLSE